MRDFFTLGPTPSDESCVSVGEENYEERARKECQRFVRLLRRTFGPEPEGAWLSVESFPHDFGMYFEVVCHFDAEIKASVTYAIRCDERAPSTWRTQRDTVSEVTMHAFIR